MRILKFCLCFREGPFSLALGWGWGTGSNNCLANHTHGEYISMTVLQSSLPFSDFGTLSSHAVSSIKDVILMGMYEIQVGRFLSFLGIWEKTGTERWE